MTLHQRVVIATLGLLTGFGVGTAWAAEKDPEAAAKGKVIYERYCGSCHGRDARGDGDLAPHLKIKPPDLTALAARNKGTFPYDQVTKAIDGRKTTRAHGRSDMPVWGEIFANTKGTDSASAELAVARIAQYLWSIQKP